MVAGADAFRIGDGSSLDYGEISEIRLRHGVALGLRTHRKEWLLRARDVTEWRAELLRLVESQRSIDSLFDSIDEESPLLLAKGEGDVDDGLWARLLLTVLCCAPELLDW